MGTTIQEIASAIEAVAPLDYAEGWDNVGLQIGSGNGEIDTVVVALDVRQSTLEIAKGAKAGLVIAHHPLLFSPITRIDSDCFPGREIHALIANGTALYVGHTNIDASPILSMNLEIGKRLPLEDFGPVAMKPQPASIKLVTFIPEESLPQVRSALAEAGAGVIGEYRECGFAHRGLGSFRGSDRSNPAIGERGVLEEVEEFRLEMVCPKSKMDRIIRALWESHPYEEVAYDLYPMAAYHGNSHFIWKGNLTEPTTLEELASRIKEDLGEGVAPVRFAGNPEQEVASLAWCSGGGKSLIGSAAALGVDVYMTGDTGHHDALECLSLGMALVDIDHHYTERFFVQIMKRFLEEEFEERIQVIGDPGEPVYLAG
ncbi:MAG: Nif3-like dinuclear metal center hexameric protein [Candidatus Omnitrophica bacterium]|nr:Nif3-like dinuclear metal center hexameric protein [Candidatus Omnitrophota bacterium]